MARKKDVFGVTVEGDISGLKSAMNEATKVFNSTERSLKNINKELKLDPTNVEKLQKRQELYNKAIHDGEDALAKLKKEQEQLVNDSNFKKGTTDYSEKFTELELKITQTSKRVQELKRELEHMPSANIQSFIKTFELLGDDMTKISNSTRGVSNAFSTMLTSSFEASKSYESEIANIKKIVTDLSDNTISKLMEIAVDTGTAFENVSEYATFAGALGIAEDKIADFTKVMIDLNTATGGAFSGEEGAKSVVVFLNNLGIAVEEAENFGSAISYIGDMYADIGDETLQLATRMAGLSAITRVDQYDLIGLAGVMKNLGLQTSTSASAITRSFMAIEQAIAEGGDKLETFAKTSGMTADEFVNSWNKNALNTFLSFTDGLKGEVFDEIDKAVDNSSTHLDNYVHLLGWSSDYFVKKWKDEPISVLNTYIDKLSEADEESENASLILKDVSLSGVRTAETLLKLSGQGEEVRRAVSEANKAWNENIALTNKANIIYGTTENKLNGVYESLKQAGSSITDSILPYVKEASDKIKDLAQDFADLDPTARRLILTFATMTAGVSKFTGAVGGISKTIYSVSQLTDKYENLANVGSKLVKIFGGAGLATVIGIGAYKVVDYIVNSKTALQELVQTSNELNNQLVSQNMNADTAYIKSIEQIKINQAYANEIDNLVKTLQYSNEEEINSGEIKEKIAGYINSLNSSLGEEAVMFDETSNSLIYQGEQIDSLSQKYDELAFKLKKQNWLDTHQESLNQAYSNIETAKQEILTATDKYWEGVQEDSYFADILSLLSEYNGDIEKVKETLKENNELQPDVTGIFEQAKEKWTQYSSAIQSLQTTIDNSNNTIENYYKVASSTAENFDEIVSDIDLELDSMLQNIGDAQEKLDILQRNRETYRNALTDEQAQHDEILEKFDSEIEKLESEIQKRQEVFDLTQQTIDKIETWVATPAIKEVKIVYSYEDIGGGLALPSSAYRGTIYNSGGFGSLMDDIVNSISNTVSNALYKNSNSRKEAKETNSGGYGSVTLNASFVANGNLDESQALRFADLMTARINENLGRGV